MGIKSFKRKINSILNRNNENFIERFTPLEKMFLGKILYIHDIASFHIGEFEIFSTEMYKFKVGHQNPYIIDCGANIGMSLIYFKELYPNATITAFEADEYIFDFLKKNVDSYELKDVEIINKAVWNTEETMYFFDEGGAGGRLEKKVEGRAYKRVKTTRLKKYLTRRKVDLLKIDIEGAEYEVIRDCENELKNVSNIFLEYHSFGDKPQNLHQILEILKNAGFIYHIKEANVRKAPFLERELNNGMDMQLNVFCYRK